MFNTKILIDMHDELKFQTGEMEKYPRDMTPQERAQWEITIAESARQYLFSIGQPLVYKRDDGRVVAEHKDGRIDVVR